MILSAFRFDAFELRPATRELCRGEVTLHLPPRVFVVLHHLIEHRERLCSERELLAECWPGERVTRSSLTQAVRKARQALGDNPAEPRFIATAQRGGYRFIHAVAAASPPPTPRRAALPGREAEGARLQEALRAATGGEKRTVLLEGEAGAGKSTLAHALAEAAQAQGATVGYGACPGDDTAPPFWPWYKALEGLLAGEEGGAAGLEALRLQAGPVEAQPQGASAAERLRLYDACWTVLRDRAQTTTVVLVLEDFHWADPSCQELLRYVARAPGRARLLIVCTYRPEEAPALLTGLARQPGIETVRLAGLALPDVQALLEAADARDLDAEALRRWSGGNPLFLRELISGHVRGSTEANPPAAVREVLARRLGRLSAEAAVLIELAAVIGERFDPTLLQACAAVPAEAVDEFLVRQLASGLLREDAAGRMVFSHTLLREVAYARIAPRRRAELHATIAEVLARHPATDHPEQVSALAHHAVQGASVRNAEAAIDRAVAAAEMALAQRAHAEAARYFGRALEAARFATRFTPQARAHLLQRRAAAEGWAGERASATQTLREVYDIGKETSDGSLVGAAATGLGVVAYVDVVGRSDRTSQHFLEEALALAPPEDASMRARLLTRMATLQHWSGDGAGGAATAEQAVATAARSSDLTVRAQASFARYVTRLGPAHDHHRLATAQALLALAREAQAPEVEVAAALCLVHEAVGAGAAERLDRAIAQAEETLTALRHPLAGVYLGAFQAQLREPAASAAACIEVLGRRLRASENPNTLSILAAHSWVHHGAQGTLRQMRALFDEGARQHPGLAAWGLIRCHLALEEGDALQARRHYAQALEEPRLADGTELQWHASMFTLCALVARFADREAAARLYPRLHPHKVRHAVWGFPAVYAGPQALALGHLAATMGEHEGAVEHFAHAIETTRRLGATLPLIDALLAAGEHLRVAPAASREQTRGRAYLREAQALAVQTGYRVLATRAERLLALPG